MLLSNFVRLYQALDQANIPVKLDIYEGMPHDFQFFYIILLNLIWHFPRLMISVRSI
jgi:acetyl esterase/lipase